MKRTSNKILILAALVFGVLPALSYLGNALSARRTARQMRPVLQRIVDNDIHVVEVTGRKASEGMLYVQNAWRTLNLVELNIEPRDVVVHGDTLSLHLADRSDVYQGRIILANLKQVVRNGVATELKEH